MNCFKVHCVLILILVAVEKCVSTSKSSPVFLIPCESDEDCDHLENAKCQNSVCECEGSRLCQERSHTLVTKIEADCDENSICNMEYSKCSDNKKCECIPGYVKSTDRRRCLIVSAGLSGSCEESVQCYTRTSESRCHDNKCVCQQHMHDYNGSCYMTVELGQHCIHNGECSFSPFSECINSQCTCIDNYVLSKSSSRCLPVAEGQESPCVDNVQCTEKLGMGSGCLDGFCRCKEMYQLKKSINRCVRDMLLGDFCGEHSDCHGPYPGIRRMECILGTCKCRSNFIETDGYCISSSNQLEVSNYILIVISCIIMNVAMLF